MSATRPHVRSAVVRSLARLRLLHPATADQDVDTITDEVMAAFDEALSLCSDGRPVHDFKGQPSCPSCGHQGIRSAT